MKSRKIVFGVCAFLLLAAVIGVVLNFPFVRASGTIYIQADGSVAPPTAPIQRDGNVYTFTDNIHDSIVVEQDNIVIDGNGYTLRGAGGDIGLTINANNITLKNTVITGFDVPGSGFAAAIYSLNTSNNIITNNTIINNKWGINLEGVTGWTINSNIIANNSQAGIYIRDLENNVITNNLILNNAKAIILMSSSNRIYHNNFINNTSPGFEMGSNNVWDDGYPSGGNYWSDYTGVDANGDRIGDTLYSAIGIDRYPLMQPFGEVPTYEVPSGGSNLLLIAGIIGAILIIGAAAAVYVRRR